MSVCAQKNEIDERKLRGFRLLKRFQSVLASVRAQIPRTARESHGLRIHQVEEYLSLFLLGMFNPVLSSMRALCQASRLGRVQEQCGTRGVSLSRFSEAQAVFDPELMRRCLSDLVEESAGALGADQGGFPREALRIVDSNPVESGAANAVGALAAPECRTAGGAPASQAARGGPGASRSIDHHGQNL